MHVSLWMSHTCFPVCVCVCLRVCRCLNKGVVLLYLESVGLNVDMRAFSREMCFNAPYRCCCEMFMCLKDDHDLGLMFIVLPSFLSDC